MTGKKAGGDILEPEDAVRGALHDLGNGPITWGHKTHVFDTWRLNVLNGPKFKQYLLKSLTKLHT